MTKKRIGIKYCGGCNPTYERVQMIQKVQSLMEDRFFFLPHDQQDLDLLLLMNGCPRACADENSNRSEIPYCSILGENDFETLINWLITLNGQGEQR